MLSELTLISLALIICRLACVHTLNDRPIIGILEQERDVKPGAFIAAPYVKFLEMGGARVVPVALSMKKEYYKKVIEMTNGLLFPGGARDIMHSSYRDAAEMLYNYAMEANDRGEYYPIWGVCQGFQILTVLTVRRYLHSENKSDNWLTNCDSYDVALNLDFAVEPKSTRLFANADENVINILKHENIAPNYHHWCMTPKNFTQSKLTEYLRIITTNKDTNGLVFISTYESVNKSRPIYALQWHPEKTVFEFDVVNKGVNEGEKQENIPHNYNAILITQYLANFFVNETRKNGHSFGDMSKENRAVIYKNKPRYTLLADKATGNDMGEYFSQLYEFYDGPQVHV